MKCFYTEYVNHCLRFYSRHPNLTCYRSEVDKKNWLACDRALNSFEEKDKVMLIAIYNEGDSVMDNVNKTAKKLNINRNVIWKSINDLERKVAKYAGLI